MLLTFSSTSGILMEPDKEIINMNSIVDKSGSITNALYREIVSGIYREKDKLPGERKLCEYFNVSRNTVRAVLSELESNDIIKIVPKSGAFISRNAIEMIEKQMDDHSLHVHFIMAPIHQMNPIVSGVFNTFVEYSNPKIKVSVLFAEEIRKNVKSIKKHDIAVVFNIDDSQSLTELERQTAKLIVLNKKSRDYDFISPNNYSGGQLMGSQLLKAGHRNIGCILNTPESRNDDFEKRHQGLQDSLEEAGGTLCNFEIPEERRWTPALFKKAIKNFMDSSPPITAIACVSDKIAVNIFSQLFSMNLSIPNDFSIIGFDDQYYAQYTQPPLSSIKYPAEAMGILLARKINDYIDDQSVSITEVLEPVFIRRQSIKKIKQPKRRKK